MREITEEEELSDSYDPSDKLSGAEMFSGGRGRVDVYVWGIQVGSSERGGRGGGGGGGGEVGGGGGGLGTESRSTALASLASVKETTFLGLLEGGEVQ